MTLLDKILSNPDNDNVFQFAKLDISHEARIKSGDEVNEYDEGGVIFFNNYASLLPEETQHILNGTQNILVNEENGQIFAFHFGRFAFAFKCDFERNGIRPSAEYQIRQTLDGWVDIRPLGNEWALLDCFVEEEQEQLKWAYELSKGTT